MGEGGKRRISRENRRYFALSGEAGIAGFGSVGLNVAGGVGLNGFGIGVANGFGLIGDRFRFGNGFSPINEPLLLSQSPSRIASHSMNVVMPLFRVLRRFFVLTTEIVRRPDKPG